MARPDFTLKWAGSRLSIPAISAGNYAAGWDTYLGPLPPLGDDHDYVMNLQDSRAIWLGEQMLLAVGHEWQNDVTYDAYAITRSPVNSQLYRSVVGGNLGNEPSVSGAQWALGVAPSSTVVLANPGRRITPDGLIEQWGVSPTIAAGANVVITLPLTFPTAHLGVTTGGRAASNSTTPTYYGWEPISTSQFRIYNQSTQSGFVSWRAWGH